MRIGLHVMYLLILSDFNEREFSGQNFQKLPKYQISWKSVQWEPSCSMWTSVWADRQNAANSQFLQFYKLA